MKSSFDVIKAPLVTEKSNALAAENKYAFKVDVNAEKIEIGKAVEELLKAPSPQTCSARRRKPEDRRRGL